MRVLVVGFAPIVVLGGLWACSSFTSTPGDATTSDASGDTAPASADAGTGDAGTFCQSRPEMLCVDFEVDGIYGGDWASNNDETQGLGSVARVATMGKDSQASLHSMLPTGMGETGATLELGTGSIMASAYLEADVFVKHPNVSFGAQLTVIAIQRGVDGTATDVEANIVWMDDATYRFVLYAETSKDPHANNTVDSAIVPFDTWVHVRLESDLKGAGPGGAAITVNGARVPITLTRVDEPEDQHTRAVLGLYRFTGTTDSTSVELFVDNVVSGPLTP